MFERYAPAITAFCRHMVGSREEAEEAVQHTFAAAYQSLRQDDRDMALKPWLYKIARNHCITILRERPDQSSVTPDGATAALTEHVERRADLRALLRDLSELPEQQREALLLTEISGLSHQEVARILGCPAQRVKGLVFRARRNLIEWRDARETPCDEIREQLATLRGTELRRNQLRHHLRVCPGCTEFLAEIRHQRRLLALALPVTPSAGLKASVLGGAGLGAGGSAAGGLSAIGAKVALVVVTVGGGATIAERAIRDEQPRAGPAPTRVETLGEVPARGGGSATGDGLVAVRRSGDRADTADPSTLRAESDPKHSNRAGPDESAADAGPGPKRDSERGDVATRNGSAGPKPKPGKPPAQAGHRSPAPQPKEGGRPGPPSEAGKPRQGPPPQSGSPSPGGNPQTPKPKPEQPRVQLPDLNPGDEQEGPSLELPVPVLDLLAG